MINKQDQDRVLQIIRNNPVERKYFFAKLGKAQDPEVWLIPLKEEGYLNPSQNPKPTQVKGEKGSFVVPYWEVLEFVLNVAQKNMKDPKTWITDELTQFISSVIQYNLSIDRVDNYRTDWILLKIIFSQSIEEIKEEFIDYISIALNTSWDNTLAVEAIRENAIPFLIENHPKSHKFLSRLFEILLEYKKTEDGVRSKEYSSVIAEYWLQEIMNRYREEVASRLKEDGVKIAEEKIRNIVSEDDSQFNIIWIPHIKDDPQNKFLDRYEIQITFFHRDCLLKSVDLIQFVNKYLQEKHPIFKRLAIYCIDKRYTELKSIFWSIKDNPLEYATIKHELFPLFQNHAKEFTPEEIERIIEWIEKKDYSYMDNDAQIYYRKKEWLYSILSSDHPNVKILYNKYNELNPAPFEHLGLDYWMSDVTWGEDEVEVPDDLWEKGNDEIADFFKDKISFQKAAYNERIENYSSVLKQIIIKNPNKFYDDLLPFKRLHIHYQYEAIRTFLELWRNGQQLEWSEIFPFIDNIISNSVFWDKSYAEREHNYSEWLLGVIPDLIEEGVKNDSHAFPGEFLPQAKKILLYLEEKTISKTRYTLDLATTMLNSSRARIYSSIFQYSLRNARLYKREEENRFDPDVLILIEKLMDEKNEIEFFYNLGKYLPNLLFLDKSWLIKKIDEILPKDNKELWKTGMSGYLFYGTRVYNELYSLLKDKSHLLMAVQTDFADREINSRVVQHICISFLNKNEPLTDGNSLLKLLIDEGTNKQLKELIHFIWTQRDYISIELKEEDIIPLLIKVYSRIMGISEDKEKSKLMSDLARWIVFLKQFSSDTYDIFSTISKHTSDHFNNTRLVEGLTEIVNNSPKETADLLYSLIEKDEEFPYYKKEHLIQIFEVLNSKGLYDYILKICNLLMKKGLYEYHEILKKYQTSSPKSD